MSQLVVISFDAESDATSAMARLRDVEKAGQLQLEDTAVITKDPAGKVNVKNEWSSGTETGAVVGAVLGTILPGLGTIIGGVAGGFIGSRLREGVEGKFVDDVSASLEPGKSALFLLVRDWNQAAVAGAVAGHRGEILQTSLSDDLVESLRQSLKGPAPGTA